MPRVWAPILVFAVLVLIPAGMLFAVLATTKDEIPELVPDLAAIEVSPTRTIVTGRQPVNLEVSWTPGPVLRAPNWNGIVTDVQARPGTVFGPGSAVVSVSGITRLFVSGPLPFYRNLQLGDSGQDVQLLQTLLHTLGYAEDLETDGSFGVDTRAAVRSLSVALGHPRPQDVFDHSWFLWSPTSDFIAHEIHVEVGEQTIPPGDPVVSGRPVVATGRTVNLDGSSLKLSGRWVFVVDGLRFSISESGDLGADGLGHLTKTLESNTQAIGGTIELTEPLVAVSLPVGAVVLGHDAETCIYVAVGDRYQPEQVDVAAGSPGTVEVVSPLGPDLVVVANPGAVIEKPDCSASISDS